jgi:hypothetical protein
MIDVDGPNAFVAVIGNTAGLLFSARQGVLREQVARILERSNFIGLKDGKFEVKVPW